jgi:hypothetical protein
LHTFACMSFLLMWVTLITLSIYFFVYANNSKKIYPSLYVPIFAVIQARTSDPTKPTVVSLPLLKKRLRWRVRLDGQMDEGSYYWVRFCKLTLENLSLFSKKYAKFQVWVSFYGKIRPIASKESICRYVPSKDPPLDLTIKRNPHYRYLSFE